jgi:preprotein translocase subunit YajC
VLLAILLAQTTEKQPANPLVSLLPLLLIGFVFYFFMIRPQRMRMRQHADLLGNLEIGDEVETIGGMYGTIRGMTDDAFVLEISPGTTVRISRAAVRRKVWEEEEEQQGSSDSSS